METDRSAEHKGIYVLTDDQILIEILNNTTKRSFRQLQEFLNLDEVQLVRALEEGFTRHRDLIDSLCAKGEQHIKYVVIMVLLPMCELHARGQVEYIISTTVDKDECVKLLTSLHREIKQIVDQILYPGQPIPDEVEDFRLVENKRFIQLLKELKELIVEKDKTNIEDGDCPLILDADIQPGSLSKVDINTNQGILSKKDQIVVNSHWAEPVCDSLKLFVEAEQLNHLRELVYDGSCQERIRFYGKQNILVDLFSRLFANSQLTGAGSQESLARWLRNHFLYKKGANFCEVSPKGAIQIISKYQNIPPDHERLCLREGLKDKFSSKKRASRT